MGEVPHAIGHPRALQMIEEARNAGEGPRTVDVLSFDEVEERKVVERDIVEGEVSPHPTLTDPSRKPAADLPLPAWEPPGQSQPSCVGLEDRIADVASVHRPVAVPFRHGPREDRGDGRGREAEDRADPWTLR